MTKKIMAMICTIVMMTSLFAIGASAAKVGDVINYAQPTDIVATINGYQLESYNVDGYTYICVEDLRYYGFDVYYDNYSRTLSVSRNWGVSSIDPQNTNPNFWSIGSNNTRKKILYTDITTYVNGNYVPSCNINGQTIIQFDHLRAFGAVNYDNNKREIYLIMDGVNYNPIVAVAADYEYLSAKIQEEYNWTTRVKAKGNMLVCTYRSTEFDSLNNISNLSSFRQNVKSGDYYETIKADLEYLRALGHNISSMYVEFYTKNGQLVVSTQVY